MADKPLTETQQDIISTLRHRGADWQADRCEQSWKAGQMAILNPNSAVSQGLSRKLQIANKEAMRR